MAEPPSPDLNEPSIRLDKRSATSAFAWSAVYAIVAKVLFPIASAVFVTAVLGPGPYGAFAVLLTLVNFSEVLRDAGLTQTYLADVGSDPRKEGSYFTVALATALLPAGLLLGFTPWLAEFYRNDDYRWAIPAVAGVVFLNGFGTIPRAKMLKDGQVRMSGAIDLIGNGLGLGTTIALVGMGYGFVSLVVQMGIACLYNLAISWLRYPVRSIHLSFEAFRAVGRRAMAVLAANGLNNLFLFADQTVVNQFAGVHANGLFGAASNLAYKPADVFIFPLTRTLMVAFSQSAVDRERLCRVYARSLAVAGMLVLPIYVFLALFAEPIMDLLFRDKFAGSAPALQAMCAYLSFRVLGNISGHVLIPAGKHFQSFYPWLGGIAVTAAGVAWSAQGQGPFPNPQMLMPVVLSFVAGAGFVYLCLLGLGLRHCPPAAQERSRLARAAAILASSSLVMAVLSTVPVDGPARLAIAAPIAAIAHLVLLGTILAGKPLLYVRFDGPRRLWSDL